jgi:asparagine synthase (glutamine-hydrolysing)
MWSFAIYDVKENSLFASRDPFGIKPFYYTANKKGFVFGSEVKSMLGFFDPSPEMKTAYNFVINELKDYSGDTFYSGVKQLEPGMNLLYKDGNVMLSKYVEPSRDSMTDPAELRSQFDESMRHHLRSDVEIGVTLSGGIDANIVASVLSVDFCKINVKVFSGVYPGKDFDESEYIDSTVSRYDLDSYKVTPDIEEVKREIPKMIWHEDQPVKVIGVLLNSAVYRLARKSGIKVVLGGQGADEIFAGYDHHLSPFLLSLLLSGNFRRFNHELNMLKQTYSPKIVQRFKKYLAVQLLLYAPLKTKIAMRHNSISKSGLYQPEFINENIKHDYKLLFRNTGINYDVYLKNQFRLKLRDYLDNEDKMSMMHSVESRVPFLGLPFVKYGLGVPLAEKIKNGVRKSILRESFGDILSPLVRDRMDKTGYASPQQEWMCNIDELLEEYLRPKDSFVSNIFQRKALDSMMKDAREKKLKEYLILWRALSLEIWHKKFIVDKGASI